MRSSHNSSAATFIVAVTALLAVANCREKAKDPPTQTPDQAATNAPVEVPVEKPSEHDGEDLAPLLAEDPPIDPGAIVIGLDADMSSAAAEAGEAIRRGAVLAIDEINREGGVLGRSLQFVVKDHSGNPARGVDNLESFAKIPNLVAVLAGLHTPVAIAELDAVHQHELVFLVPWAAGTSIIDNGHQPNYAFRVSIRDEFAGIVMVEYSVKEQGCKRLGLLLERTLWGRSNHTAITKALSEVDGSSVLVKWFNLGTLDFAEPIASLVDGDAECVLLVSNPVEGLAAIESMARLADGKRRPIVSHWGILGRGKTILQRLQPHMTRIDLTILQSFSFYNPRFPDRADRVVQMYCRAFDCEERVDIFSPAGTAHAYELVHLLAHAIRKAGTVDRPRVRDALEQLESYRGLIRDYAPPFTATRHDALAVDDLQMCRFTAKGELRPVSRGDREAK